MVTRKIDLAVKSTILRVCDFFHEKDSVGDVYQVRFVESRVSPIFMNEKEVHYTYDTTGYDSEQFRQKKLNNTSKRN